MTTTYERRKLKNRLLTCLRTLDECIDEAKAMNEIGVRVRVESAQNCVAAACSEMERVITATRDRRGSRLSEP